MSQKPEGSPPPCNSTSSSAVPSAITANAFPPEVSIISATIRASSFPAIHDNILPYSRHGQGDGATESPGGPGHNGRFPGKPLMVHGETVLSSAGFFPAIDFSPTPSAFALGGADPSNIPRQLLLRFHIRIPSDHHFIGKRRPGPMHANQKGPATGHPFNQPDNPHAVFRGHIFYALQIFFQHLPYFRMPEIFLRGHGADDARHRCPGPGGQFHKGTGLHSAW